MPFLFSHFSTLRLRTVDPNLRREAPLTSDGVGTYSERVNGTKKGHGFRRALFVLRHSFSRLRTVDPNLRREAPLASAGVETYSKRANGAKKGHGKNRVLFCSTPLLFAATYG